MRELKFRAFDTENKTWTFVTLGDLICGACTENGDKPLSGAKQVWEQYTGLKDKNGEEICEGDILEDGSGEPLEYWAVKFEDGKFIGSTQGVDEDIFELTDLEVIGNIHENPELLEGK